MNVADPDRLGAIVEVGIDDLDLRHRAGDLDQDGPAQIVGRFPNGFGGDRIAADRIAAAGGQCHRDRIAIGVIGVDRHFILVIARGPIDIVDPELDVFDLA